jgi:hypothetical protein
MIGHLEHCRHAPSAALAEKIIAAYRLGPSEADILRAEAVEGADKDSPWGQTPRRGARVFYGNRP